MGNGSISPACFRIKGNSSHLVKQMLQDNSNGRRCVASEDTTMFQCERGQMTCMRHDGGTTLKQDTVEDPMPIRSVTDENTYTYVTCDRLSEKGSILSCRVDKNATRFGSCAKESLTKCHYKSAGNKKKKDSTQSDSEVSRDDKCPQGWSFRRKRCHKHVNDPLTFDQAYTRCRHMEAFLTVYSEGSNDELLPPQWGEWTHWAENKTRENATSECFVTNTSNLKTSCEDSHPFFCYKEVFKFLQCKAAPEALPVEPTEELTTTEMITPTPETTSTTTPTTMPTTTARTTPTTKTTSITTPTTTTTPTARTTPTTQTTSITTPTTKTTPTVRTTPTTKYQHAPVGTSTPEEKLNNARVALKEAKAQIGDFVAQFTDDQGTLDILDEIIDAPPLIGPGPSGNDDTAATMVTDMVEKMDSLVDSLAEIVSGPGKSLTIENDQLVLKVIPICATCSSTSPGPRLEAGINNDSYVVKIPSAAMGDGATAAISVLSSVEDVMSTNMVDDGEETTTGGENRTVVTHEIVSLVATVSVKKWDGSDLQLAADQPFEIIFNNKQSASDTEDSGRSCCYWQPDEVVKGKGAWSTEGCVTKVNRTHTTCQCTHLTSFAVLMQVSKGGAPQSSHVRKIQNYMTYVGCGLSMTCLATMLIVFTIQKLYRSDRNVIHMNLASSLLVSQAVFLFGIDRVEIWQVCKTIGICLHFFLLATFFWMLVEGIYLISKTTSTRNRFLAMPTYIAIGWGGPAVIVGITAGVSFKAYSIEKICWLSNENGGIWAFVGPAIGIVMMNVTLLCQVIRVFLSLKTNMKKAHSDRIWLALRAMLLTLPLLGGTWLFGILSFNSQTIFFSYIFIVLNSLQGVFIFVLYCVMNDEVKKVVERKLSSISGRASNGRSTKSTT
ncbi:adhesion G-protein coupled receptor D1 isoform X1 [Strongylocentrotus purpuratus]|uniref:Uncharacterized protein n=1 Tax=Strongylocentrotus purpuratus TaxID=7668 RepID=A0A7M7NPR7_STRPU|nr:adhesion G-protein coupled receptor D1 isoform X1 [Strongylocentrotus purpuratus]